MHVSPQKWNGSPRAFAVGRKVASLPVTPVHVLERHKLAAAVKFDRLIEFAGPALFTHRHRPNSNSGGRQPR
jgi:hypothetical protein